MGRTENGEGKPENVRGSDGEKGRTEKRNRMGDYDQPSPNHRIAELASFGKNWE